MKLLRLKPLYTSMKQQKIEDYKFRYQLNGLTFDCLFSIGTSPFALVIACKQHNFAIVIKVKQGFKISTYIPYETYVALGNALKTTGASFKKFEPIDFFKQFNAHIPDHADPRDKAKTTDIAYYYSNTAEADKIYFCGWVANNSRNSRVSDSNLEKTRRILGEEAYDVAKRTNHSSKWTADPSKKKGFSLPKPQ